MSDKVARGNNAATATQRVEHRQGVNARETAVAHAYQHALTLKATTVQTHTIQLIDLRIGQRVVVRIMRTIGQ